jgi:hypothetical protein
VFHLKLASIITAALVVSFAAGCGSTGGAMREGPVGPQSKEEIIDKYRMMEEDQVAELQKKHDDELLAAQAGPSTEGMDEELNKFEDDLWTKYEGLKEEANNTLADQELTDRLVELDREYEKEKTEGADAIRAKYEGAGDEEMKQIRSRQEDEMMALRKRLKTAMDEEIQHFEQEQARLRDERSRELLRRKQAKRIEEQEAAAQETQRTAAAARAAQAKPIQAAGTQAPVQPVVVRRPPPLTDRGLRREGDAPLGQRRYYVHKYFGTGEAQHIVPQASELGDREEHEMVVSVWMEGSGKKGVPRFRLNGVPAYTWQEVEERIASHRRKLIDKGHVLYAKVIIDQQKDVPRSVVDDILTICFRVNIKRISMGNKEPRGEE